MMNSGFVNDQFVFNGKAGEFGDTAQLQFFHNVIAVRFNGVKTLIEHAGNFFAGFTFGDQLQEMFFWDKYLDTSFAAGAGPSYATDVPEIEVQRSDGSERLQVYMMLELEFTLPSHPNMAVITRVHHRSNAFGIVADEGTSNALAFGLKFRF